MVAASAANLVQHPPASLVAEAERHAARHLVEVALRRQQQVAVEGQRAEAVAPGMADPDLRALGRRLVQPARLHVPAVGVDPADVAGDVQQVPAAAVPQELVIGDVVRGRRAVDVRRDLVEVGLAGAEELPVQRQEALVELVRGQRRLQVGVVREQLGGFGCVVPDQDAAHTR